jgi:hypothetical protein
MLKEKHDKSVATEQNKEGCYEKKKRQYILVIIRGFFSLSC